MNAPTPAADAPSCAVAFSLSSPGARRVHLAFFFRHTPHNLPPHGAQMEDSPPMVRKVVALHQQSAGDWRCEVVLPQGWHEYLFLVDGAWVMDPDAAHVCPDGAGEFNALREVTSEVARGAAPRIPERMQLRAQRRPWRVAV